MTRPVGGAAREQGAALAFVILLMVALLALAHGGLVASLAEMAGSRAAVRELRVRGAADHALVRALADAPGAWSDSVPIWGVRRVSLGDVGTLSTEAAFHRLGPESWWVEGVALSPSGVTARSRRLAWALDPLTRVEVLAGAVTVGPGAPVTLSGGVDASDPATVAPPMEAGACDPWLPELWAHYSSSPPVLLASLPDSSPPGLGLHDFSALLAAPAVTVSDAGTPTPVEASGACLEDQPWVWGDPGQPWRPCGGFLALRGSLGDLRVEGGAGQALLVVDGDLTLDAGARLYGMVVVRGALRLVGGSTFDGLALAAGGLEVGSGATLRASACWALRALSATRDRLGRMVPVGAARLGPG